VTKNGIACATSYQSAIVSRLIALPCVILEILEVEKYRDLDS